MHVVIDKSNPLEYFDREFYDWIHRAVEKQILNEEKELVGTLKVGSFKKGGMIYEDLLDNDEGLKHIWIDYESNVLSDHIIHTQINDLIIYDEIPNIILDRINEFKSLGCDVVSSKTQE